MWQAWVEAWCQVPLGIRWAVIGAAGLVMANGINRAIDRLAYECRGLDPWLPAPEGLPPRTWKDRVPILGWWRLRREAAYFQSRFWFRALLIEILFPIALVALYRHETTGGLYPSELGKPPSAVLHAQFVGHVLLVALLAVATFIDFDEQTIPDAITLPGAVLATLWVSLLPVATLPTVVVDAWVPRAAHVVATTANHLPAWEDGLGGPHSWPPSWNGPWGLGLALAGLAGWYLAVLPKLWLPGRRWRRRIRFAWASIFRYRTWPLPTAVLFVYVAVVLLAYRSGGHTWQATFSSVTGLVLAGGGTWAVRLVASGALRVEALGFGDVTLMAMIGAALGWQPALIVFGLAPFTALGIALIQRILTGSREIAFGPYLCTAAVVTIVAWRQVWFEWARLRLFATGLVLPVVLAASLLALGTILYLWQRLGRRNV